MKNIASERAGQAGFTLLELLISLLLTSLLTVLVYGGLQIGMSSWEKVIDRNEVMSDAFLTQRFLRRLLETARPELVDDITDLDSSMAFLGLENELLLLGSLPRYEEAGEPLWIYLSIVQNDEDIAQLEMATAPYDPEQSVDWDLLLADFRLGQEVSRLVLVADEVEQIEFNYLEMEEEGFSRWQPEWRFLPTMPAAVQIRFISGNTVVRGWPDLIVTPREDAYAIRDVR